MLFRPARVLLMSFTACFILGCDPAASEQGTIQIKADPDALQKQILSPEGINKAANLKTAPEGSAGSGQEAKPKR